MQIIQALIRKIIMLIQLQILDSIIGFGTYMMEKIWDLISIYYQLQKNDATLLYCLSDGHKFLNLNLHKVWSPINLSHS